jgi:N-acetylglucosaminyldiphosphoundecaprenol N-acetyl-beta-D-mannosaminyltransferase
MTAPPALLFGVPIDRLSMEEAVDAIGRLVEAGRATGRTHQVATVNVDFLVNAFDDPAIHRILADADLCVGDGMPIVWSARLLGMPLPGRVTGADLVPALAERSARTGWRIHIFGGAEGVALRAAALLNDRFPGAMVTAESGPTIGDPAHVDPDVIDGLRAIDADILCLALGNPKQERFIDANRGRLGTPVLIGIGGTPDLLVGERRRAPAWIQRVGLEWVFRTLQEPRRLGKRYARDIFVFLPRVVPQIVRARRLRGADDVPAASTDERGDHVVDLAATAELSLQGIAQLTDRVREATLHGESVRVRGTAPQVLRELRRFAPPAVLDATNPDDPQ